MPVESVSKYNCGFVLMDDYSRVSWVPRSRAKSDASVEFEKWARLMENGTDKNDRTVMFDNARKLAARRMKAFCDERGIRTITSVPYSPSSNGVALQRVAHAPYCETQDSLHGFGQKRWGCFRRTPTATNDGKTPYELFYGREPDVRHVRTFGCIVKVVLPNETLGKLAAMGYLLGYKYDSGYRCGFPGWECESPRILFSMRARRLLCQSTAGP